MEIVRLGRNPLRFFTCHNRIDRRGLASPRSLPLVLFFSPLDLSMVLYLTTGMSISQQWANAFRNRTYPARWTCATPSTPETGYSGFRALQSDREAVHQDGRTGPC